MNPNQTLLVLPIDSVIKHPKNPRQGDVGAIAESVRNNGWYGALIVQKSTNYILAGNHRWMAAKSLGFTEINVITIDVSDETALRILLADNRTSDVANNDEPMLVQLLQELSLKSAIVGTGFDQNDLDELIESITPADFFTNATFTVEAEKGLVAKMREKWGTLGGTTEQRIEKFLE